MESVFTAETKSPVSSPGSRSRSASFEARSDSQKQAAKASKRVRYKSITDQIKKTPTKQAHHFNYSGTMGVIDIDSWALAEKNSDSFFNQCSKGSPTLGELIGKLKTKVGQWDCKSSIILELINLSKDHYDEVEDLTDVDINFIQHLDVLEDNISLRKDDFSIQCATKFSITSDGKKIVKRKNAIIAEEVNLDWNDILIEARSIMKEKLIGEVASPSKAAMADITDMAIYNMACKKIDDNPNATERSLRKMTEFGFLDITIPNEPKLQKSKPKDAIKLFNLTEEFNQIGADGKTKKVKPEFNFSKGHIGFILLLEWKAVAELLNFK